ncbi:MAG: peptide ABC transporter substrate-binding protein [Candidatus Eremiobacteraeota bacterium]|nr:peptide ABC transporter substrate-binding protein [Candidatus Eremiobacteraeota bacterium]
MLFSGGCTKVGTQSVSGTGNPWTHHGRLVFAEAQDVKSLNPMLATSATSLDLSMLIFSYAVRYDEHSKPVPDAVREIPTIENGDVSKDGLTLKYKLRPNMRFHDGVAVTCRDLKFTWKAVLNPKNNGITQDGYRDIKDIDCSDPLVAVVHMRRIYAPYLQQLWSVNGNAPILPAHILEKYNDDKGSFNTAPFQGAPIGSGPFRFVGWQRGSQVTLKAFDGYFLGRPKLDEVILKIVPSDNTMVSQLRTHEIDLALHMGSRLWPDVQGISGTTAVAQPIFTYDHIDFNLKQPLFADVRLRRALAMGVDRKGIVEKIAHGLGDLTDTALSPVLSWAWTKDTAHYDYDPAKAKALLDDIGWKVGPDGIRVRNGRRLAFNYSTQSESTNGQAIEALVQSMWHDVGADVTVKNTPTAQFFDNTAAGILQGGHYDVAGFAWGGAADPDDSAVYSGRNLAPKAQNALFWNDAIATKAMDDELATVDRARRQRAFTIEQQRFASEVPSIILYYRREPVVYNTDLKNFRPSPVISPLWNPHEYAL